MKKIKRGRILFKKLKKHCKEKYLNLRNLRAVIKTFIHTYVYGLKENAILENQNKIYMSNLKGKRGEGKKVHWKI